MAADGLKLNRTLRFTKAWVSCCVVVLLLCSAARGRTPGRPVDPPNIVIILADDLGYGDVQALNPDSQIPTPHLNRLARDGMTFTDSHSPSAVCTPTRYALLTGRYCWRSQLKKGVLGGYSKPLLETGRSTIASMLKTQGYRTGAIGKWHLGMELPTLDDAADTKRWDGDPGIDFEGTISDSPVHHGFDNYFGVSASLDMAPYVFIRDDRFTMKPSLQQPAIAFPRFVRKGPRAEDFEMGNVLDDLTKEAVQFVTSSARQDAPYFLYLPLTGPHKPAWPHTRFEGATSLGAYGDFVHQVDWSVGQVLTAIDESDEGDNTLVFFTSDNGSYMYRYDSADQKDHVDDEKIQGYTSSLHTANGLLRGTKADIWEAGHRVPCFVRWPVQVEGGTQCHEPICHTDFFATCSEIAGHTLTVNEAEDSFSLLPHLQGQQVHRGMPVVHHSVAGMFAIRDGEWKLIAGNGSGGRQQPKGKPFATPFQLYNLKEDIGESTDVAAVNEDVVKRLTHQLSEIRRRGSRAVQAVTR